MQIFRFVYCLYGAVLSIVAMDLVLDHPLLLGSRHSFSAAAWFAY
jgi:hypothetical protein